MAAKIPLQTEDVTPEWLSQVLQVKIDATGFKVTGNAHEGTGFLSNLLRISCQEQETGSERRLIVKLLPQAEDTRSVMLAHHFDQVEIQTYQKIHPDFTKAAPELELKKYLCSFVYGNYGETETESGSPEYGSVLILQDLKPLGFAILDPLTEFLSLPQIESGLDFLARFHCTGKVVEKQHAKPLPEVYSFLQLTEDFRSKSLFHILIQQSLPAVASLFAEHGRNKELGDKILEDYQQLLPHTSQIVQSIFTVHDKFWLCANHGDLWPNNVLLKKGTQEFKIIDWQLVNYSESVRDIAIFIFSSLSPNELTKANVQRLVLFYFEKYASFCEKLDIGKIRDLQTQFEDLFNGLGIFHAFFWFILSQEAYVKDIPRFLHCLEFQHREMNAIAVVKSFLKL